ncbi:MAG: zinc-ribbon domain-containing protein [Collinsella aerofaciens]|nr:zinc-ribbon domain-containing protein [Collinsella aerofaciens]
MPFVVRGCPNMSCTKCGSEMPDGTDLCTNCGAGHALEQEYMLLPAASCKNVLLI